MGNVDLSVYSHDGGGRDELNVCVCRKASWLVLMLWCLWRHLPNDSHYNRHSAGITAVSVLLGHINDHAICLWPFESKHIFLNNVNS